MLIPPKYDTRYHRVEPIPISCKIRCNKMVRSSWWFAKGEVPSLSLCESAKNTTSLGKWQAKRPKSVLSTVLRQSQMEFDGADGVFTPCGEIWLQVLAWPSKGWAYSYFRNQDKLVLPTTTNRHQQSPTTTSNHQQQIWQLEFLVQNASVFPDVPEDKSAWKRLVNWDRHPSSGDKTQHKSLLTNMISRFWLYKCVCVYV
jgi:hypothetical protein